MRAAETAIAPSRRGGSAQGRAAWVRGLRDVGYCGNAVGAAGQNNEPRRKAGAQERAKSCEEEESLALLLRGYSLCISCVLDCYCTTSPCRLMSRPSTSTAWLTRRPMMMSITLRMMKVMMAQYTNVPATS